MQSASKRTYKIKEMSCQGKALNKNKNQDIEQKLMSKKDHMFAVFDNYVQLGKIDMQLQMGIISEDEYTTKIDNILR